MFSTVHDRGRIEAIWPSLAKEVWLEFSTVHDRGRIEAQFSYLVIAASFPVLHGS